MTAKIASAEQLAAVSLALLGGKQGLSPAERALAASADLGAITERDLSEIRRATVRGDDPLGQAFAQIRSPDARRELGAVYTPHSIVRSMIGWLRRQGPLRRIVDPGAGSGRFVLSAAQAFPRAELVAVETDPLAALMFRASARVRGYAGRTELVVNDFRSIELPAISGATAFIGNPPYVRHHDVGARWKDWYAARFAEFGIQASSLAGLHLHFFLKTRLLARPGDLGAFITSSEWMDVNYGSALRRLLLDELGGLALHVLQPTVEAFPGTATTAAITCFRVGEKKAPIRVRSVRRLSKLNTLSHGRDVSRRRFAEEARWSIIVRPPRTQGEGELELGEFFRVHRGQVTGMNDVWIEGEQAKALPERVRVAAITKAKDLIEAGARLTSANALRRVVDLPPHLDEFSSHERKEIDSFLKWARSLGADQSYIAQHRRAWWSVGLKDPAPVLCTYMARRAPQFTLNNVGARHINVAHGLYPREPIDAGAVVRLVDWLNENVGRSAGRTYAGGLIKFEPKEIERLRIPRLESLAQ